LSKIEQYHLHKLSPQNLQFEVYDLNSYRKKWHDEATTAHSHSYYQIIWFTKKGGTHQIDFKEYPVDINTLLFIGKDQIHAFDKDMDIEGWLIHFNDSFFTHTDVDVFLKFSIFRTGHNPCYKAENEALKKGERYLELILDELRHRNRFGFEHSVRFLLKSFLINMERIHLKRGTSQSAHSSHELLAYRYKELVDTLYTKHLRIQYYAEKLFVSTKTLTNTTKKVTGKSPSEILRERIILQSKRLLRFTNLQVNEIAYQLGFEDPSYFVKYFKRHVNLAPMAFRESQLLT